MQARFTAAPSWGAPSTIRVGKFLVSARIEYDHDMGPPWVVHDGHGPVTDWVRRPKLAGERILSEDRGSFRYYDFAEAVKIAKRDNWDAEPYGQGSAGQRAATSGIG